jgi:hypothetical protein
LFAFVYNFNLAQSYENDRGYRKRCVQSATDTTAIGEAYFCPLTKWDKEKAYDEDPLSYIHYSIEWKVTVNNRVV